MTPKKGKKNTEGKPEQCSKCGRYVIGECNCTQLIWVQQEDVDPRCIACPYSMDMEDFAFITCWKHGHPMSSLKGKEFGCKVTEVDIVCPHHDECGIPLEKDHTKEKWPECTSKSFLYCSLYRQANKKHGYPRIETVRLEQKKWDTT